MSSAAIAATFINLSSDDPQVAKAANQPVAVTVGGMATPGFTISGSKLTFTADGDYFVYAAAQIGGLCRRERLSVAACERQRRR